MYNTIFEVRIPDCNNVCSNLSVDLKCLHFALFVQA